MTLDFKNIARFGPAALAIKGILVAAIADLLLLSFILLRRGYRGWYFRRRDARVIDFRQRWEQLICGEIPFATWRNNPRDCQIVESMALEAFESSDSIEAARILKFLRSSGIIAKCTFEARRHRGWRRREALVALGRTRAPEAIPALAEALRDHDLQTRLAAIQGLGRMSCPEAGGAILDWISEMGLIVPAHPVQSALIQCCAERPQMLLSHLQSVRGPAREVLARVLGEIGTSYLKADLLQFVDDELPELRAAAARALSRSQPNLAIDSLNQLSQDPVWFVRLRAMVSLGELRSPSAIPILLRGLTDSKRLVRVRAAEALIEIDTDQSFIFEKVVACQDRYGIDAYLTVLDNAGLVDTVEKSLQQVEPGRRNVLLEILRTRLLPTQELSSQNHALAKAASTL